MSSQLRHARLTGSQEPEIPGGGIPLPGVFHDILFYLLNNNRVASEEVLVKVVRDSVGEDLNGARVRLVWGSWETFTRDLLDQLEKKNHVAHSGLVWMLAARFRTGRIRILTYPDGKELQITVRSKEEYETRELLSRARLRATDYRLQLEAWGLYVGGIKDTFDAHVESLHWERTFESEPIPVEDMGWQEDRSRGAVTRFAAAYLESQYPRWVTGSEVAVKFNEMNPSVKPISRMQPFERIMTLVRRGQVERRDGESGGEGAGRGRPKALFRWKPSGSV